jgi:signal peptidase I
MRDNNLSSTAVGSDLSREFTYDEKPRISPQMQLIIDIGETIVLTIVMFFVIKLAVQDYQVDGTSMVPTLQNYQYVLVDKVTYDFSTPARGDIIVFEYPLDTTKNYIKRIVGIPGDHVYIDDNGQVSVNGVAIKEPYVNDLDNSRYGIRDVVLGPNEYYVLGDNRGGSSDSREWGVVKRNLIIGRATLVYWPLSDVHFLPDGHGSFKSVPNTQGVAPTNHPGDAVVLQAFTPMSAFLFVGLTPISAFVVRVGKRRR